jgi:uncharacterized protein
MSYFCENVAKMLIYFKVGNFKSIKDPVTLNFNASSISEHNISNVIQDDKIPLLKSILLYGHNASGKSKILDAFVYFIWFINNSATDKQSNEQIDVEPFEFYESTAKQPSFFEVSFILGKMKYRYGFEADKDSIHKEWLLESKPLKDAKEYPVFLRIKQNFEIEYKRFENSENLDKRTRKNALFLSVASQWNVSKAQKIDGWIQSIFTVHGMADDKYRNFTIDLLKEKKYTKLINNFIKKADLGINSVDVVDIPIKLEDIIKRVPDKLKGIFKEEFKERSEKAVFTIHNKYNDKNEVVGAVTFLMDKSESEGTKKYFNIIGLLITALLEGRVVIIDEFDARLHTILTKAILKLFNSSIIKSNAQLLVASHDTALLDRELLRRDQIYFIEKDNYGASKAISLVEYKPRKDTPYDKNYLEGKYGAIPFIEDLENLITNGKS